jgi:hypothetical protein
VKLCDEFVIILAFILMEFGQKGKMWKLLLELLEHLLKPELPKDAFKSEIYDKTTNTGVM